MRYNEADADDPCPKCGGPCIIYDWWDDPPEDGGACLEIVRECTVCDWGTY